MTATYENCIPLSGGLVAIVDDDDYQRLAEFTSSWYAKKNRRTHYAARHARRAGQRVFIYMHRQVMGAAGELAIDHINGDGLDNRKENLRFATTQQNGFNRRPSNAIGLRGVTFHRHSAKWQAQIRHNGKWIYLGLFLTAEAAARCYDVHAKELYGAFARLNYRSDT